MIALNNLYNINAKLARHNTTLLVVSKNQSIEKIIKVYQAGQRLFAENRVQDLLSKKELLPDDISWHMIGTLQRNKVKYIAPFIAMIHSIDNMGLAKEVNKQAQKHNRIINCLLQIYISKDDTKFGFDIKEVLNDEFLIQINELKHIRICGLMGMATLTDNEKIVRQEFKKLKILFDKLKPLFTSEFKHLSMGMSGDYHIALEEGSTLVRIGSAVFDFISYK